MKHRLARDSAFQVLKSSIALLPWYLHILDQEVQHGAEAPASPEAVGTGQLCWSTHTQVPSRVAPTSITLRATGLPSTKQLASCSPAPLWPMMCTRVAAVAETTRDWGVPGRRRVCHGVPPACDEAATAAGWLPSNTFHLRVLIAGEARRACFFFVQFGNFSEVFSFDSGVAEEIRYLKETGKIQQTLARNWKEKNIFYKLSWLVFAFVFQEENLKTLKINTCSDGKPPHTERAVSAPSYVVQGPEASPGTWSAL